ncbi:unnamed protein product [Absidia cylindrospora]
MMRTCLCIDVFPSIMRTLSEHIIKTIVTALDLPHSTNYLLDTLILQKCTGTRWKRRSSLVESIKRFLQKYGGMDRKHIVGSLVGIHR